MPSIPHVDIESLEHFDRIVAAGATSMTGWRVQSVPLLERTPVLRKLGPAGSVFLGCALEEDASTWIRDGGGLIFPAIPELPFDPYRGFLYSADELYAGLSSGYEATPDAQIYAWSRQQDEKGDTRRTLAAALHDHSIADALAELPGNRPWIGVMGGHGILRGDPDYRAAVLLGRTLARAGLMVATGGGPGAMEAANLGASLAEYDDAAVQTALDELARVPSFRPSIAAWAAAGLAVRGTFPGDGGVSIPTWFYGHEPPNVFAGAIAKYFSNAQREDVLLSRARGGIIYLPGAAGTVQEIFQAVTPNYYGDVVSQIPLILIGVDYWTQRVPVWPLLQQLAADRTMASSLHLVDTIDQAAKLVFSD
ncbi:Rossmann fold nucleotide-binding protein [Kribbella qitaiheensis]|uniref:Rossmann fold nucleotide-binding protein n=1 Tax=Kribbella qitaiheensis TaxID=1544730 RepID=A0A7G6X969_9ACTN|nr:LOG family protein [Kribbella qitaiheensis]QNE22784.1 Rossmann fold nucleotide-binding protein [Kribbella qitaiheensis]